MPKYESIHYTWHSVKQMRARRITDRDVERALEFGDGRPGKHGKWLYEFGNIRVVIVEEVRTARIITVIRLRGRQ